MSELSPFTESPQAEPKEQGGALVEVAMQREVAEIQAAMTIAKKFPRNQAQATDRILISCQRPTLAEGALYTYARGGSNITGPSIRLAEAIAQQWGNLQFGIRELEQRVGESTVEAYAWDLETNTRQVKIFQVKHVRHTKKGAYNLYDPRDIYELTANQGARRLRACILGVIPGDVVEAAVTQCENTLTAKADISSEAIQKMVGVFKESGVTREMIEKRIQRKLDSITPAQVISLRKIFNSIKDGMSSPADWFEFDAEEMNGVSQTEKIKEKLRGKKKGTEAPATAPPPSETTEVPGEKKEAPAAASAPQGAITASTLEAIRQAVAMTGIALSRPFEVLAIGQIDLEELSEAMGQEVLAWYKKEA